MAAGSKGSPRWETRSAMDCCDSEIKAAVGANVVDPRKMTAYSTWKFVEKNGDRLKLSERGWRYARKVVEEPAIFREVSTASYLIDQLLSGHTIST